MMSTPKSFVRFAAWRIRMLVLSACVFAMAHGAQEPKRHYDLRANDAAVALREFSEASGREILFAAEIVRGVRTSPVQGEFTVLDALNRMFSGTNLYAVEDEHLG